MILPSYSREPFSSQDYDDGEIYPLDDESRLGQALLRERWLNMDSSEQAYWLGLMRSPSARFVGTIVSSRRRQVELTLCFRDPQPRVGLFATVCVTLAQFQRFV